MNIRFLLHICNFTGFLCAGLQGMELPLPQLSQLTVRDSVLNFIEQFDAQKLNVNKLSDDAILEWGVVFGCDLIAENDEKTEEALKEILKIVPEDPNAQKFIPKLSGQRRGKLLRITPSGMAIYHRVVEGDSHLDIYSNILDAEKINTVKIGKIPFRSRFFSVSLDGKFFSLAEPEDHAVHLFDLANNKHYPYRIPKTSKIFAKVGASALVTPGSSMNLLAHTDALLGGSITLLELTKDMTLAPLEQPIDKVPLDYVLIAGDYGKLPKIMRTALQNYRVNPDLKELQRAATKASVTYPYQANEIQAQLLFFEQHTTRILVDALSSQLALMSIENENKPTTYRFIGYNTQDTRWKALPEKAESYQFMTRHSLYPSQGDYTIDQKGTVVIPGEQIINNTTKPVLLYFGPSVTHIDLPANINITKSKFALSPDGSRLAIFSNEPIITKTITRPLRIFQIAYDSPEKPVLAMPLEQLFVEMDADASLIWLNQGIILNGTTSKTPLSATAYLQYGSIPESFTFFLRYKVLYDEQRAQERRAFYSVPAKKKKF